MFNDNFTLSSSSSKATATLANTSKYPMMVAARGLVKKLLKKNPRAIWAWPHRNRVRIRTAALVWGEGGKG